MRWDWKLGGGRKIAEEEDERDKDVCLWRLSCIFFTFVLVPYFCPQLITQIVQPFSCIFSSGEMAAGKRSLYLAEIADVTSPSNPQKALQVAVSGIQCAGNQSGRASRRISNIKRTTKSNENKTKTPNPEELINLIS